MAKQIATVEGMTCDGCANTVQTKFSNLSHVSNVKIDLDAKTATLETEGNVSIDDLSKALEDTPYEVKDVQ